MNNSKDINLGELLANSPQHRAIQSTSYSVDRRPSLSRRITAYFLSFILATQPLLASAEAILSGTTNTQKTQAQNGVPVINIAKPSAKGISHNQYQQYNVSKQGLILNNSKSLTATQLGGYIIGNPNLQGGSANLILNEVIGANRSQLNGYTEVAGQSAAVIVANPYGITCNGCGFINTPRATLTTGTPNLLNGGLAGFSVSGGDIAIEGLGLNASNINRFDIITRAVKVNAEIQAKNLNFVLGANQVNYADLATTTIAPTGGLVNFALDSSVLGGMYANAITLVGTEAGVGVRTLANVAADAGDLHMAANGELTVNNILAANDLTLTGVNLFNHGLIAARGDATLNLSNTFENNDFLFSAGKLDIFANNVTNERGANIYALGDMRIAKGIANDGSLVRNNSIINRSATIESDAGDIDIATQRLSNIDPSIAVTTTSQSVNNRYYRPNKAGELDHSYDEDGVTRNFQYLSRSAGLALLNDEAPLWLYLLENYLPNSIESLYWGGNYKRIHWVHINANVAHETADTANRVPAKLLAGGNLTIDADETINQVSLMAADGDINITGNQLNNNGLELRETVTGSWSAGNAKRQNLTHDSFGSGRLNGYTVLDNVAATIVAGGGFTGDFTGQIDNTNIRQNESNAVENTISQANTTVSPNNSPDITLPIENSLLTINRNPAAPYLIETNPLFAEYGSFLSSDYFLDLLNLKPEEIPRRLGDGYYETRLIRDAVFAQTGRRYIADVSSDVEQYQRLMDNALAQKDGLDLTLGVRLSPEQVENLTADIVWFETQTVDGQEVLAPVYYAATVTASDINGAGALLAGKNLNLTAQNIHNKGAMSAEQQLSLASRTNITNRGTIKSNGDVSIDAQNNIVNRGGNMQSGDDLSLVARTGDISIDRDLNQLDFGPLVQASQLGKASKLQAGGDIKLTAGRDVKVSGSQVKADDAITVNASRDINIAAAAERQHYDFKAKNRRIIETRIRNQQSQLAAGGDVTLNSNNDINIKGSSIESAEDLALNAANNISISSVEDYDYNYYYRKKKSGGSFSSKKKTTIIENERTRNIGSSLSADRINVAAGAQLANNGAVTIAQDQGEINIKGSDIVASNDVNLDAGKDINITTAQNVQKNFYYKKVKRSGFSATSTSVGYGTSKLTNQRNSKQITNVASTVGSVAGDVNINSGKTYNQTGSNVLTPAGDVNINAQQANITAAQDSYTSKQTTKYKQSGITLAIKSPVIDAIKTVDQLSEAAQNTKDGRMQALAAGTAALTAKNAYESTSKALTAMPTGDTAVDTGNALGGVNLSLSIGSSKSKSTTTQTSTSAKSSQVIAGGDVNITATGAGKASDINVIGSQIKAGDDVTLKADDQINLIAAKNVDTLKSKNKNSSASVGVSVGSSGFLVTASASGGKGKAKGNGSTWTETTVQSGFEDGDKVTLDSGTDTTLKGAQVIGNQVVANVGTNPALGGQGNLNIQSLQDTNQYKAKQKSVGGSISVGPGTVGGSFNSSNSKTKSNFASVNEQSGIFAGDAGFDLDVRGKTDLKGAVIASTNKAVQDNKNSLTTQTLTTNNINNEAEYEAKGSSFGAGIGTNEQADGSFKSSPTASAGSASDSDDSSSITVSGVSGSAVNINDNAVDTATTVATLNRDVTTQLSTDAEGNVTATAVDSNGNNLANTLEEVFDQEQVQRELNAQIEITQAFSQVAPKAVGDYAGRKLKDNKKNVDIAKESTDGTYNGKTEQEWQAEADKWDDGGVYRVALHTIVGGLSGNLEGALGAGASAFTIPILGEEIAKLDIPVELKQALVMATSTAIGSAVGGTAGAGAALSEATNNYLKHDEARRLEALQHQKFQGQCDAECEQKIENLISLDKTRNQELQGCANVATSACNNIRQDVRNAAAEYILSNVQGSVLRYSLEKGETLTLAQQTLSGLGSAQAKGFATTIVDGITSVIKGGFIAIAAFGGHQGSSEKVGEFGANVVDFLKVPGNWQALIGGLSESDRVALANAYEQGDGDTVGNIIGTQVASIPLIGGALGVGAKFKNLAKASGVERAITRITNGVKLDARLPDPKAGLGYEATLLDNANPNIANSHINGYRAELKLANNVAALPNQAVVKFGDKIGEHGSDLISVNVKTGAVTLWDSKFRSGTTAIKQSPTFKPKSPALDKALAEAIREIDRANLPPAIRKAALENLEKRTYNTNTVAAGNVRNSVSTKVCNNKAC